mmetsp:Transcript_177844/g.570401  ORF Transcript_177844/g.570401 Transcript_177844/m.570401 type:complete len:292 (-) Transcript_177844:759-1634(-)
MTAYESEVCPVDLGKGVASRRECWLFESEVQRGRLFQWPVLHCTLLDVHRDSRCAFKRQRRHALYLESGRSKWRCECRRGRTFGKRGSHIPGYCSVARSCSGAANPGGVARCDRHTCPSRPCQGLSDEVCLCTESSTFAISLFRCRRRSGRGTWAARGLSVAQLVLLRALDENVLLVSSGEVVRGLRDNISRAEGVCSILHRTTSSEGVGGGLPCGARLPGGRNIQLDCVSDVELKCLLRTPKSTVELPPREGSIHQSAKDDHLDRQDEVLPSAHAARQGSVWQQQRLPKR